MSVKWMHTALTLKHHVGNQGRDVLLTVFTKHAFHLQINNNSLHKGHDAIQNDQTNYEHHPKLIQCILPMHGKLALEKHLM